MLPLGSFMFARYASKVVLSSFVSFCYWQQESRTWYTIYGLADG